MNRALVTGGAGFIGSHLVESLLAEGWRVRVFDDLSTGAAGNLPRHADLEFLSGDVRDAAAVGAACVGVDVVFHLAALVSVPLSVKEPRRAHDICATGTFNVLEAANAKGVRRAVYAASSSCYGDAGRGAIAESAELKPGSPYAAAKLAGEHYCSAFAAVTPLETVRLRFFNVFGPRQDPSSPYSGVISIFCRDALAGKTPTIFGDGLQTRDFIYVADVVAALRRAAESPGVSGRVYNLGRGEACTLLDLLASVADAAGVAIKPNFAPARVGDILHSMADVSAAKRDLGFAPKTSVAEGLVRCLESLKAK
ncbi:MAG TPA: NAD-dependent epimerase/dehydratase family protein [Planctomycetia bacterium]|nr:NAD-dependent epimerase/dehydratase family protein [Planctomycetia bacterium]